MQYAPLASVAALDDPLAGHDFVHAGYLAVTAYSLRNADPVCEDCVESINEAHAEIARDWRNGRRRKTSFPDDTRKRSGNSMSSDTSCFYAHVKPA